MKSTISIRSSLVLASLLVAACHTAPTVARKAEYVDSAVCAPCHAAVAKTYSQTGMARGFETPNSTNVPLVAGGNNDFYHPASRTHFQMLRRGKDFFQRRWQADQDSRETNVDELKIDYVMAPGTIHVRTFIAPPPETP